MPALKRRLALVAWVGLLVLVGCSGQGGSRSAITYTISGAVSGAIADGVLITLSGTMTDTTTSAGGGLYSFSGLANGSYTLTASKAGYTFGPARIAVTVNGGNVTGRNFSAFAFTAVCSADNWCWQNPLPQGNPLYASWGSGTSDVWVVGRPGTVLHWNGSGWSSVSSGTTNYLSGIWGSASDVWVVGSSGTILRRRP